ncbi:hypothetical protein J2S17_004246 [Cytobacillus purgationiresistens]|uniref:Tn3 transposase DDE domain-containing protein n=1 Tax=Cytobacillus purgationiresistens TaxID=863449 RepID=A0ABU0AM66_9BACI|nr:Tn3 family transposase [Cytobacillus purgationiresistens]MDQ0272354.1 hypothetical protein [Cytobacillus purgationiresistens]
MNSFSLVPRSSIQAATNKSEAFNGFTKWLFFGGEGIIAENDRDKQRKMVKFNHLVSNCLIFYNVFALTRLLHEYSRQGKEFKEEIISDLSPYISAHVNRFGKYRLRIDFPPSYNLTYPYKLFKRKDIRDTPLVP